MNIAEIETEIAKLEDSNTSWQSIERLSWLYVVRDHLLHDDMQITHVQKEEMPQCAGEFGQIVSGKQITSIMNVLSEHMSVIKILYPKEYQAVVDKIADIQ